MSEKTDPEPPRRGQDATELLTDSPQVCFQRCKLVRLDGPRQGEEYELKSRSLTVGSDLTCDLVVRDSTVSREHFTIAEESGRYILRDEGSTNGTYVDDLRVKEIFLKPGGQVRAGNVFFRFELAYEPAALMPSDQEAFGQLLGRSMALRQVFAALERVAPSEATILLQGETGTGKSAFARAIHEASAHGDGPFVVFDCGAVQPNLVESELFGHERGAFTGASERRSGALEDAAGGTLFIDELAELSLGMQPKLLRALEEREFSRVGSSKQIRLGCRVIAASQIDLWKEVLAKRFRQDLYFRLAVVTIPVPPLRARVEDIPLLVDRFLEQGAAGTATCFEELDERVKKRILSHSWPGNIRELRNVIERLSVMGVADIAAAMNPAEPQASGPAHTTLGDPSSDNRLVLSVDCDLALKDAKEQLVGAFEREYLVRLLRRVDDNIARAAREAGLGRRYLYTLMEKYGLREPE